MAGGINQNRVQVPHERRTAQVIDWTHPVNDRRQPAPRVQGAWLIRATHLVLIGVPGLFAAVLMFNPKLFISLSAFQVMASVASEQIWACSLFAVAGIGLWGFRSRSWLLRVGSLFALGTAHWSVAMCFLLANPLGTGTTTYSLLAALAWCFAWEARRAR